MSGADAAGPASTISNPREALEMSAEPRSVEPAGGRQLAEPGLVAEIGGPEAHHVLPRDLVALRRSVDAAAQPLAAALVEHLGERDGPALAALDRDEGARPALLQVDDRGVA